MKRYIMYKDGKRQKIVVLNNRKEEVLLKNTSLCNKVLTLLYAQ